MSTETQSRIWLRNYLPAFVWAAFILTLTLLPGTALPALRFMDAFRPDKVAHFMVFAIQALLLMTAFNKESVSGGALPPTA